MKTIAVIESCDTKYKEAKFISDFIKNEGLEALVLNTATGPAPSYNYDISREEIGKLRYIMEGNGAKIKRRKN